ncbi:DUF1298 domain-containing protein [Solimonas sp. K1W22B-7]|uniref:wax ester/triacylglycerol synthase domain-containing protein n=1 Tax=Solimonas sp. K1W22B-7 TaxID=2303331 RepID=UPI000E33123C|nr:wax ester/triacylglycerol synthase domain-containing protein [Solimonas sp. K1W22B-7]AXQ31086.1 DUF1298 domain-containing protein [Solimonas sp. K1W22B-7]
MNTQAIQPDDSLLRLQAWGGNDELDDFETLMWQLDERPNLRAAVVGIEILDCVPDWGRLVAAHELCLAATPRLRSRIVETPLGLGNPGWSIDPGFRLDHHLRRVCLSSPGGLREVLDQAQRLAMAPFDKSRSPWEALLVEGLADGSAAYILKLHHSMTDGMGIVQLLGAAHSRSREPLPRTAPPRKAEREPSVNPAILLARQWGRALSRLPATLSSHARGARRLLGHEGKDAGDLLVDALRYGASAQRVLAGKPVKGSPLLAKRNHRWHFEVMELPLSELKAAARRAESSLNDAFVSGLMGGFARYHRRFGSVPSALPVSFPISLRTATDQAGGNRFVPGQFAAPLAEPDPVRRMQIVGRMVSKIRNEPALELSLSIMPMLRRLPLGLVAEAMGERIASQDLQLSNVPGIRDEVYLAGARVTQLYPFAPLPGCAAMVTLVSHGPLCCIGLNLDEAAINRPELLMQDLHESFAELLDSGHTTAAAGKSHA